MSNASYSGSHNHSTVCYVPVGGIEQRMYLPTRTAEPERTYLSNLEVKCEKRQGSWEHGKALADYLVKTSPQETYFCNRLTSTYYFSPGPFLHPNRPTTQFIGDASDIEEYVREAFRATTGDELPDDIAIRVCSPFELRTIHENFGGKWSRGIQGFAVNRRGSGVSEIFVKENFLDALLLVIGHEIGHVLSEPLPNPRDEEAKAFAFEMAWMRSIKEHNIAGLAGSIVLDHKPAQNGLHNVAFSFIHDLLERGKEAFQIYLDLVKGGVSLGQPLEILCV